MLLIGTMNITRTRSTGDFYCPTCGSLREYRLRARRPFLTIYFVPVVPIGAAEEFVQCTTCKTNSPLVALEQDEHSFRQSQALQFRNHLFEACVMTVTADGAITAREIETLIDLGRRLLPEGMDRETLGAYCSSIQQNKITVKNFIVTVSKPWSMQQKKLALQYLFIATTSEGQLGEPQLKVLTNLRDHFGMSQREYESAIEEAVDFGPDVPANMI
jgi:hypothetical protein